MTLDKFANKVTFESREVPATRSTIVTATFKVDLSKRISDDALRYAQNEKEMFRRVKEDIVRVLYHDIFVDHRETFNRYLMELRANLDMAPNVAAVEAIKKMKTLFD